jgi:hypothetical protein
MLYILASISCDTPFQSSPAVGIQLDGIGVVLSFILKTTYFPTLKQLLVLAVILGLDE